MAERALVSQAIERRWTNVLDMVETRLLQRICDLTVHWGRDSVDLTLGQIIEGWAGTKEWRMGPLGCGRTRAEKALKGLRERDLLTTTVLFHPTTGSKTGMRFTPNVDLILAPWEIAPVPPSIPTPKRLKNMIPATRGGVTRDTGEGYPQDEEGLPATRASNILKPTPVTLPEHTTGRGQAAPGGDFLPGVFNDGPEEEEIQTSPGQKSSNRKSESAAEAVQKSLAKSTARRMSELQAARERIQKALPWARGAAGAIRGDDLWTVWSATHTVELPYDASPALWTKADRGAAMGMFKRWTVKRDGEKPNGEFDDFLIWVVAEWRSIISDRFGWMTTSKPPETPNIRFVAKFFDAFEEGFVVKGRKSVLTRLDLTEFEELRAKGFSEERALEEIAKRKFAKHRNAPKPVQPRPLPVARTRSRPGQPLQPVATESRLTPAKSQPTSVVRQRVAQKDPAAWERELWGDGESDG